MNVWLAGPSEFDDFKVVYETLEGMTMLQHLPEDWKVFSMNQSIFDNMGEWYGLEVKRDVIYGSGQAPDFSVVFHDDSEEVATIIDALTIKQIAYQVIKI